MWQKLKPMIISTGMSKISEIDDAVEAVKSTGNKDLILLHCNSSYPSTYAEVNLKFIETLKKMYNIPIGFSDHNRFTFFKSCYCKRSKCNRETFYT